MPGGGGEEVWGSVPDCLLLWGPRPAGPAVRFSKQLPAGLLTPPRLHLMKGGLPQAELFSAVPLIQGRARVDPELQICLWESASGLAYRLRAGVCDVLRPGAASSSPEEAAGDQGKDSGAGGKHRAGLPPGAPPRAHCFTQLRTRRGP